MKGLSTQLSSNESNNSSWNIATILQSSTDFIDRHLQLFQRGSTVIACIGLFYISRSIRIHKKFYQVADIPQEFIRKHVRLQGKVIKIAESYLTIDHLPIVNVEKWFRRKPDQTNGLQVKLAGITLHEGSHAFVQKELHEDQLVWFQLLAVDQHEIEALVTYKQNWYKTANLNELIVRNGFGKVANLPNIRNNKLNRKITQRLLKAELAAEKAKHSVWDEESALERWKGRASVSWNGAVNTATFIVGTSAKIVTAPISVYKTLKKFIGKFRNR